MHIHSYAFKIVTVGVQGSRQQDQPQQGSQHPPQQGQGVFVCACGCT